MTIQVSNTDMHGFARIVWMLAGSDSSDAQTAMAWLIVNRMAEASNIRSRHGDCPAGPGECSLAAACNSVLADQEASIDRLRPCEAGFGNVEFCRVFSIVCRVWSGDLADPTSGAVDFHGHSENPDWSRDRIPSALIGRHFYYP